MEFTERIDYLVIGHICRDLTPAGPVIGGTAAYAAATARVLGCRTAVVTSYADGDDWQTFLPDVTIYALPSPRTTTFENVYTPQGRIQTVHAVASTITASDIPLAYRRPQIAHIGPVANEVEPSVAALFSNSMIGLTPQGWMRAWDEQGHVTAQGMQDAQELLPLAAATFISDQDLISPTMLDEFRDLSRILVLTQGAAGSIVYFGDQALSFPAPHVRVVDETGAGDIFATAYMVRLHQTGGDPWEAARFANRIAALSVTEATLPDKMRRLAEEVARSS
jgi:sugar/nucleoside kinase (ribokinase family)